ncbi:hypothetical protein, partial [Robiginitalea sp.]|uniref:hypothetical protein n=1 Tax=Robiginitalea sp. TaxID=1902411 RepID=UPI003C4A2003
LEIGAALERVRSRSMAMQSSEELNDVLSVLYQQFDLLGIQPLTVWLTLWNTEENTFTYRSTGISGKRIQGQQVVDIEGMDIWKSLYDKWKSGVSEDVEVLFYSKKDLKQLFNLLAETFEGMPEEERLTAAHAPEGGYSVQGHCKFGYIGYTHTAEPTQEEKDILSQFAKEFGRVYQRFLDIGKAEAQAREAQIEVALERVRARSMAMHTTEEILDVVVVLFNQLRVLNIDFIQAWISIWHLDDGYMELWLSPIEGHGDLPIYHKRPSAQFEDTTVKSWLKGDRFSYLSLPGEETVTEFLLGTDQIMGGDYFKKLQKKNRYNRLEFVDANHRYGTVSMSWNEEIPENDKNILSRFAQVFEQTYTRFLDLEKAEAQAREAQIEASLERVRSRSMAMQSSDELNDVLSVVFHQFDALNINPMFAHLALYDLENNTFKYLRTGKTGERNLTEQIINLNERDEWKEDVENFKNAKPDSVSTIEFKPEVLPEILELFEESQSALPEDEKIHPEDFPNGIFATHGYCKFGYLGFDHTRSATEEEIK